MGISSSSSSSSPFFLLFVFCFFGILMQLKDRTDQPRGIWDDVYRKARRIDWTKNELHERDEGELERTGQPLCIYEPYFGEGTWPFLHQSSLYRGLGLVGVIFHYQNSYIFCKVVVLLVYSLHT